MMNRLQGIGNRLQSRYADAMGVLFPKTYSQQPAALAAQRGMTLVETLVAISILAMAIVAPMSLTMQSLSAAYYSRDQVIASNLAQEAIEGIRSVRDRNILLLALSRNPATCASDGQPFHILCDIPINQDFIIDVRIDPADPDAIDPCAGVCPNLKTDNNLYGHEGSWTIVTPFRRTVEAVYVGSGQDEIRVTVTVQRTDSTRPPPPVVISENLYRWVADGISG